MTSDDIQMMADARLAEVVEDLNTRYFAWSKHHAEEAAILSEAARLLKIEKKFPDNYNFD